MILTEALVLDGAALVEVLLVVAVDVEPLGGPRDPLTVNEAG